MSTSNSNTHTIQTSIPARLDRLPWSSFHWLVVIGLGAVWILDGLEVTIIGSVASRLTEAGSGIKITASGIGLAAAFYVGGACLGALFFGQLTDRFGRKRLFLITLGLYVTATTATAFSWTPWFFYLMRFLTGAGIGGEYSAINSAIDELIPARVRGRVDLIINGSYWAGAGLGAVGALLFLDNHIFPLDIGWRIVFAIGAVIGLTLLFVRRHVPESPRWLFIHGRQEEAERLVVEIEKRVQANADVDKLEEVTATITVEQRKTIPFREIARTAFKRYPRRTILGLSLFIGQAFLYNAVTFDLGTLLSTFFKVSSGAVPLYIALFAFSNLLGPLLLGRLFDTVGRKPMVSLTYLGSAGLGLLLALLFMGSGIAKWPFMALVLAIFFLASAGASAAYLTVSEIFPMETRALAIAFFYAVGTAIGGITGPILFGSLISTGKHNEVAIAFFIGAGVMAVGGIAELLFGIKAEQRPLEEVAQPLTAKDREGLPPDELKAQRDVSKEESMQRIAARRDRQRAGLRRYRPGPGYTYSPRGMIASVPVAGATEAEIDRAIEAIVGALQDQGPISRRELARLVGARYWGPGVFSSALREALAERRIRRSGRDSFEAVNRSKAA